MAAQKASTSLVVKCILKLVSTVVVYSNLDYRPVLS